MPKKPTSQAQHAVARKLGIHIDNSSFAVAAAQIQTALAPVLTGEAEPRRASVRQVAYASSLSLDVSHDSMEVASVRIQERLDERNAALIREMKLAPGVRVAWKKMRREMVISSIASNGRLWFKGGNGNGAFPHEVDPTK